MDHPFVITIISGTQKAIFTPTITERIAEFMEERGVSTGESVWLKEGIACDFYTDILLDNELKQQLHSRWPHYDIIAQPRHGRRKKLLISDMDSTIINQECIDELAAFAGLKDKVSAITERAMNGELDFEAALTERVALLKDLPESVLQEAYDKHITPMAGAKELVTTMSEHGAYCVLVSGGFTFFTARVAEAMGFHEHHANRLEIQNGKLSGKVIQPILGKEAKLETLHIMCEKLQISTDDILAVGDGANDLPMLKAAGLGIAYHAKPAVQAQVDAHVNHNNLQALLYVQGYSG